MGFILFRRNAGESKRKDRKNISTSGLRFSFIFLQFVTCLTWCNFCLIQFFSRCSFQFPVATPQKATKEREQDRLMLTRA